MNVDLDVLKGLAEAAGGDLWTSDPEDAGAHGTFDGWHVWRGDGDAVVRCFPSVGHLPDPIDDKEVADFVAAASPAVVLALIEKMETSADTELALHRSIAAATLHAEQGWARYEAANNDRNDVRTERIKLIAELDRLNSSIAMLQPQAEALHFVGHILGLPAGSDVAVDVLVTVREIVAGAKGVVEQLDERGNQAPGHCHTIPGRWDDGNKPEIAGKPCEWCAMWARFKRLAGNAS